MGISPIFWGRQAWHFIHFVALNYPEQPSKRDKQLYLDFLYALPHVLPCPICGSHFMDFMVANEPQLGSRDEFFRWSVDAHNEVNKRNDKKLLSYDEAYAEVMKNANEIIVGDFNSKALYKVASLKDKLKSLKQPKQ